MLLCQRTSPLSVCYLLCYSANKLHITSIVYEFQALKYTHYQHVYVIVGSGDQIYNKKLIKNHI